MMTRFQTTLDVYHRMARHRDFIFFYLEQQLNIPTIPALYADYPALQNLLNSDINTATVNTTVTTNTAVTSNSNSAVTLNHAATVSDPLTNTTVTTNPEVTTNSDLTGIENPNESEDEEDVLLFNFKKTTSTKQ